MLEGGIRAGKVHAMARELFPSAMRQGPEGNATDNLRFLVNLEPLPARVEDWPASSREAHEATAAIGGTTPAGAAIYRCKALGPDGLCSIYDHRPGTCRDFTPSRRHGCHACASFGTTCKE